MPLLRTLVADDEPLSRAELAALVEQHPDLELVATCSDGPSARACLETAEVDLAILDVEMPGCSGLEVVRSLGSRAPRAVVFATAHPEFAVEAFEVRAIDYLLKPYDPERFAAAVERAQDRLEAAGEGARLVLRKEGRMEVVVLSSLRWVEAADQYVLLHTTEGNRLMRESMARMEAALAPHGFLRVHRSAIVPLAAVRELRSLPSGGGELVLDGGDRVPVSRSRAPEVRRALG
jgi:two-component system LytT family response regulator